MPLTLVPPPQHQLWPLHSETRCGSQLLAGQSLKSHQGQQAPANTPVYQWDNAWVSSADWQQLLSTGTPATLYTNDGQILAWTTSPGDGHAITSSTESFLIRYPWQFLDLNQQLIESSLNQPQLHGEVSPAAHIDGVIHLGEGSRILPGVVIEGKVSIGRNCKIGPNCYLRGATSIGDHCHIGQAVEIKNAIIGSHSCIAHLSYVGDSVIGRHVNFGAGTISSNFRHDQGQHFSMVEQRLVNTGREKFGTIVGDHAHTGILTAIYPGRKIGAHQTTRPNQTVRHDIT